MSVLTIIDKITKLKKLIIFFYYEKNYNLNFNV